jgi:uncharacterized protein (TIGR01777 family)
VTRRIAITGATGFIGQALAASLRARGDTVLPVRRAKAAGDELSWEPGIGFLPTDGLSGVDAVVHLAGAGVADQRWTEAYKQEIERSRVVGTKTVVAALAAANPRPRVLVSASAVGWYGDTGDTPVDEAAPPASDFLGRVCAAWEHEAAQAAALGVRIVRVRVGFVLAKHGGALAKVLPIFRAGLGGRLGTGRQWVPWIHLDDVVRIFEFALDDDRVSGPVNAVAPAAVTNAAYTAALASAVRRPAVFPAPKFAVKLAFGEFADAVFASQRVVPARLQALGFQHRHVDLAACLRAELAK